MTEITGPYYQIPQANDLSEHFKGIVNKDITFKVSQDKQDKDDSPKLYVSYKRRNNSIWGIVIFNVNFAAACALGLLAEPLPPNFSIKNINELKDFQVEALSEVFNINASLFSSEGRIPLVFDAYETELENLDGIKRAIVEWPKYKATYKIEFGDIKTQMTYILF